MPLASPAPCHGQRGLRPLAGGRISLSKAPSGRATVPLPPSLGPTLRRLQLYYTPLATAEGEHVSSASFLLFWRTLSKASRGPGQLVFPMEMLHLHAGSAPGELSPRTRGNVPGASLPRSAPAQAPHPSAAHRCRHPVPEFPPRSGSRGGTHRATTYDTCLSES